MAHVYDTFREAEDNQRPYLHCQVCDSAGPSQRPSGTGVDTTLVSRFLGLLEHHDAEVVVAVVKALPTVVLHTTITGPMVSQYLALLTHQDKAVVSALCRHLPALVCVREPHHTQVG